MNAMPDQAVATAPAAIEKACWQPVLFAPRPRRSELAALIPTWPLRQITVAVHRNAPFEFVAQAMPAFLAYAGLAATFHYSDYDDSLQIAPIVADLHLVWLSDEPYRDRLPPEALAEWLVARLNCLRATTPAPILVANRSDAAAFSARLAVTIVHIPGARVCDLAPIRSALGPAFHDHRLRGIGDTDLSGAACVLIARQFGLAWLPAVLRPRLKCIAVDLDNTLYQGVLGEDDVHGLVLTDAHRALQSRLVALRQEGLFLAAVSRNDPADVTRLFAVRGDFPLKLEHFSAWAVGWGTKSAGLAQIVQTLRIGLDAVLFVDDNLGEIAEVSTACPSVACLHAADPAQTCAGLTLGPDLLAWTHTAEDRLRATDLAAATTRAGALAGADNAHAYLRSLETRLEFALNPREQAGRIRDLSQKTNQFNIALRRLDDADVALWLDNPEGWIVTARLVDRLSDSGIVGVILMRLEQDRLCVEEICISCRALGRGLEDLMIGTGVDCIAAARGCGEVAFAHATGPRNAPARDWLARFVGTTPDAPDGYVRLPWPPAGLAERLHSIPVRIDWKEDRAP